MPRNPAPLCHFTGPGRALAGRRAAPCPPPTRTTPTWCSPTWRCRAATAAAARIATSRPRSAPATRRFPSAPTRWPPSASRSTPVPRPRAAGRSSSPQRADAAAAVALAAVRLYQPDEASAAILRTHALGGDEALIKLIGELSDAGGTAITLEDAAPDARGAGRLRQAADRRRRPGAREFRFRDRAQARGPRAHQRAGLGRCARAAGARADGRRRRGGGHRHLRRKPRRSSPRRSASPTPTRCCGSIASTRRARNSRACAPTPRCATRPTCASASSPTRWAT